MHICIFFQTKYNKSKIYFYSRITRDGNQLQLNSSQNRYDYYIYINSQVYKWVSFWQPQHKRKNGSEGIKKGPKPQTIYYTLCNSS